MAASEVLNHLRQSPNNHHEDAPLMTKPHWWIPSSTDISFSTPHSKRKQDPLTLTRGAAIYSPARPITGKSIYTPPWKPSGDCQTPCTPVNLACLALLQWSSLSGALLNLVLPVWGPWTPTAIPQEVGQVFQPSPNPLRVKNRPQR